MKIFRFTLAHNGLFLREVFLRGDNLEQTLALLKTKVQGNYLTEAGYDISRIEYIGECAN